MRWLSLPVVALGVIVVAAASPGDTAQKDQKRLQGTWVIQSFSKAGKAEDDLKGTEITFAGKNVTIHLKKGGEEKELKATYTLDPTKTPKHMDLTAEGKNDAMRAIYEFKGDTLRICHGVKESERPTGFSGDDVVVVTLQRKKASR